MGNNSSKHNTKNDGSIDNSNNNNNNIDERVINEMKESLDSDVRNGNPSTQNISKVSTITSTTTNDEKHINENPINNIRNNELPVGDSPIIESNTNQQVEDDKKEIENTLISLPPPPVEINKSTDYSNHQLIVDNVNEELLTAMKLNDEQIELPPLPPVNDEEIGYESKEEKDSSSCNDSNYKEHQQTQIQPIIESDANGDIKVEVQSSLDDNKSPPINPIRMTRERFQTKAEAELLSLFQKTPIVDITVTTSPQTQQPGESIEEILASNFFNDSNNYSYKDVPKNQKSLTLSRKIYNTLTRKKSRKASDGYSTVVNKSQTTGDIASLSRLDDNDGEGSSSQNVNYSSNNSNLINNNNNNERKYNTVSMKMSTFRKKLFHSQQDLHTPSNTEQDQSNLTEANDINKQNDDKKKKKFFSGSELSNIGSMFSREMGHVFLLSPSGPAYCSYTTSGF